MKGHFFDHINLTNYHFPPEFSDIWRPFHETYGVDADLCILGIGSNGHIAFNEPGTPFDSITRIVELDEKTIKDNARFFLSIYEVPTEAITMGLKTIMSAKKIVLMAAGEHKKDILDKAMNGKVTEKVPASILQKHNNVEVYYCD
jgi:glucosamine-6-phosphate deaminase